MLNEYIAYLKELYSYNWLTQNLEDTKAHKYFLLLKIKHNAALVCNFLIKIGLSE